jgi:predicted nucleotidyltransferase
MPAIRRMILFGSLAKGLATPKSDADILIVVDTSAHAARRDRLPDVLAALSPLPGPIDVSVLTRSEFDRALADGAPLVREALAGGIDLL